MRARRLGLWPMSSVEGRPKTIQMKACSRACSKTTVHRGTSAGVGRRKPPGATRRRRRPRPAHEAASADDVARAVLDQAESDPATARSATDAVSTATLAPPCKHQSAAPRTTSRPRPRARGGEPVDGKFVVVAPTAARPQDHVTVAAPSPVVVATRPRASRGADHPHVVHAAQVAEGSPSTASVSACLRSKCRSSQSLEKVLPQYGMCVPASVLRESRLSPSAGAATAPASPRPRCRACEHSAATRHLARLQLASSGIPASATS